MFRQLIDLFLSTKFQIWWKAGFWLIFLLLLILTLSPQAFSPIKITHIDKLYHLIAFAGFTFAFRLAFRKLDVSWLVGYSILVGLFIEIAQSFIPHRWFSLGDLLADIIGVLAGLLVAQFILRNGKANSTSLNAAR